MEQSSASTQKLRDPKDKGGPWQNRQNKADSGQTARRAQGKAPDGRGQSKPLEMSPYGNGAQMGASKDWEIRCPELGQPEWIGYRGPASDHAVMRIFADALDHDQARPIAFGRKVEAEMREKGNENILRFEITGKFSFSYFAKRISG